MSKPVATTKKKPDSNKVSITLHDQTYIVTCDTGEEKKLAELVAFVNAKLEEVAQKTSNVTEIRLFMLTCLLLADELQETRRAAVQNRKEDEALMVAAVDHLRDRVLSISEMIEKA